MTKSCKIDFKCIEKSCDSLVVFSLPDIEKEKPILCPVCSKKYTFRFDFVEKTRKFSKLIDAVQDAKDILGDTNVAIKVDNKEVKIPYRLLLTRMNTIITLKTNGGDAHFRFRVEPLNEAGVIK